MTTNDAFIKAFRPDRAQPAAARPALLREAATVAAWQPAVEIVAAEYGPYLTTFDSTKVVENGEMDHGAMATVARGGTSRRRPLSEYLAEPRNEPSDEVVNFTPETTVSAFRWPRVCHLLWEQYHLQYERVVEQIVAECRGERKLVGVAGLRPGDGCTTTLLCLAMELAARDTRAVLVDAHFAAPRLAHRLGVEPTATWCDVLGQGLPVAEAVIRAAGERLDLLPLDRSAAKGVELAGGLQAAVTAGVLRHAYEVALMDLGPILDSDTFAASSLLVRNMQIDMAILVVDAEFADPYDVAKAGQLLGEQGCPLLGAIENRVANSQLANHGPRCA
jgi:MinD-like ATPase involved in chromosome partitioning or flagellar assembly